MTILIGDFNAIVGHGKDRDIVGKHGLGVRNEYTWKATGDSPTHIIRNQIDFSSLGPCSVIGQDIM